MIKIAIVKPVQVTVLQWTGHNPEEVETFCYGHVIDCYENSYGYCLHIETNYNTQTYVKVGDYIVKHYNGNLSVWNENEFNKFFELE